ncbi:hypothetical protein JVU11DRAFT_1897 [Chiua virens]|nr:hypothetical protein JVU11DRAFT_1897 [Chiua virens]
MVALPHVTSRTAPVYLSDIAVSPFPSRSPTFYRPWSGRDMSVLGGHPFRHLPPSPPDTDAFDSSLIPPMFSPRHPGADFDMAGHYQNAPERTRLLPRRTSALSYQHSGPRELRDRSGSYSRGPRNLVVVIPPPEFPLDHGQLGNVLSMGPRHRLSQGSLMPLFPSMFGQLNAIAREYNFPSTVGLCLYLHINESGITMTPRISDDSWQYLFGHLFENRAPSSTQQLPIGGSIEFDIDLEQSPMVRRVGFRTLRDPDSIFPSPGNAQASFGAHWRGESQPRGVDEQVVEDRWDASTRSHTLVTNSQPATLRHVPKKLSLVDRLESLGVHAPPRSQNHTDHPESPPIQETAAVSPIPQSAIPRVPKDDLELRVNSWRETTELYSVSMTETYQPAPDVGVPVSSTTMDAYAMERNFQHAHDACIWSPTSAGPRSPAPEPESSSPRPSSVNPDHHVRGSVPITPAIATSWGPVDDEWHSVVVSTVSPLPSPDTGERVAEDTIASRRNAVWGNSFGWCSATTWNKVYPYSTSHAKPAIRAQLQGGVSEYPNLVIYPAATPVSNTSVHLVSPSRSVWGSSFGWEKTWQKVYPYSVVTLPSTAAIQLCGAGGLMSGYPNLCIYPAVYPHLEIYPAVTVEECVVRPVSAMLGESNNVTICYPSLVIYPAVYPHFDLYPTVVRGMEIKALSLPDTLRNLPNNMLTNYPNLVIYPAVYPHFDLYPKALQVSRIVMQNEVVVKLMNAGGLAAEYPNMIICKWMCNNTPTHIDMRGRPEPSSAVWGVSFGWLTAKTWIQVYPLHVANPLTSEGGTQPSISLTLFFAVIQRIDVVKEDAVWGSSFGWKDATTWRAVWPTANPRVYPEVRTRFVSLQNATSSTYPNLVIYPAIYPCFAIYPPPAAHADNVVKREAGWGSSFGWKDATTWHAVWPTSYPTRVHPEVRARPDHLQKDTSSNYPYLVIYPTAYPHFSIYPPPAADVMVRESRMKEEKLQCSVDLVPHYPNLVIYPAVYPYFDLYPAFATDPVCVERGKNQSNLRRRRIAMWRAKTAAQIGLDELLANNHCWGVDEPLQLDLAEYAWSQTSAGPPTSLLEPLSTASIPLSVHLACRVQGSVLRTPSTATTWGPQEDDRYSDVSSIERLPSPDLGQRVFDDAPPTVPVFIHKYPHLVIYPLAYPYFDLYPACANAPTKVQATRTTEPVACVLSAYPHLVIYPPVYPYIVLYPACASASLSLQVTRMTGALASISQVKTLPSVSIHKYPHLVIYPLVYPHFDLYPTCATAPTKVQVVRTAETLASTREAENPASILTSVYNYPHLVIYTPVYPYFDLYPACAGAPTLKNQMTEKPETFANSIHYPVFDIYPVVYPYFNIYPAVDLRRESPRKVVSAVRNQPVEVRLPSLYPNLDIYPAGYPSNLDSIYPSANTFKSTQITVAAPDQPVYPFIIPYPGLADKIAKPEQSTTVSPPVLKSVSVKLPVYYPTFDLYPAGYPWSLEFMYPPVLVDDRLVIAKPSPLVQLDPVHVTGMLDEADHASSKVSLATSEDIEPWSAVSAAPPDFDLFPLPPTKMPRREQVKQDVHVDNLAISASQNHTVAPRTRKTHLELHNAAFRSLGKRPARITKTHQQLHDEVFQVGVVWTPSGYTQDLSSLINKKPRADIPMVVSPRRPSQDSASPRIPRSRPAGILVQSPEKVVFPLVQPPALPPISPRRVRSPAIPSQPSPAVSESPMPRVTSPTNAFTHKRTTSSRLTQAVKAMLPGLPRRSSSASRPTTPPPPEEHNQAAKDQHAQTPIKFSSLVERRPTVVPEILTRVPQRKESLVLQRAKAYEQSTTVTQPSGTIGHKVTHTSFMLPPLPSIPPMTDMVETFEKSKLTFP